MKLLVATDFSPQTRKVLQIAGRIGQALSAQLWLIHVAAPEAVFKSYGAGESQDRKNIADGYREERRLVHEAAESLREVGLDATGLTVQGTPAKKILSKADELGVGMIVIGSHGFGAVSRLLLGSVSSKVLKKATCPVLIVPSDRSDD